MTGTYPDGVILKILNGVQAGVDVALVDGDYILGSGDDADIQIFDISLSPHHAKLTVRDGKVSVLALSGSLHMRSGTTLNPGDEITDLPPLDLITAGTSRFAIAPATADWAAINHVENNRGSATPRLLDKPIQLLALWKEKRTTLIATGIGLLILGFWIFPHSMLFLTSLGKQLEPANELALTNAIEAFDFTQRLQVQKNKDGTFLVSGVVDRAEDRHTVIEAINETGIAARTHILVLDAMRDEVKTLLADHAPEVSFTISPRGDIALQGAVPDEASADNIIQLVKDMVGDATTVRSEIKTHDELLKEVDDIARRAQVSNYVQFHLNEGTIEAEGAIAPDQLDAWAGFLQSYSTQFSRLIPLRSLVRAQDADGNMADIASGIALYLGADDQQGDRPIDIQRLANGTYTANDLLIGGSEAFARNGERPIAAPPPASTAPTPRSPQKRIDLAKLLNQSEPGKDGTSQTAITGLDQLAQRAIQLWESGKLREMEDGTDLSEAIDALKLSNTGTVTSPANYKTLLQSTGRLPQRACWSGSAVSYRNITGVLFWLDILSHDSNLTIAAFDDASRTILAEAALNPAKVADCAHLRGDGALNSSYLESVSKEPHLVRGLLRNIPAAPVEITGLSLPGTRYFQTNDNRIFQEGALVNANTSVLSIGELGIVFSTARGISVAFVDRELAWQTN